MKINNKFCANIYNNLFQPWKQKQACKAWSIWSIFASCTFIIGGVITITIGTLANITSKVLANASKVEQVKRIFNDTFPRTLGNEIQAVEHIDKPLKNSSWRNGPGKKEEKQTFNRHSTWWNKYGKYDYNYNNSLYMHSVGAFSKKQRNAFPILSDYLKILHGVDVEYDTIPKSYEEFVHNSLDAFHKYCKSINRTPRRTKSETLPKWLKRNQGQQISIRTLHNLNRLLHIGSSKYVFCLSAKDVTREGRNYVFGSARSPGSSLVISTHRLGNAKSDFKNYLKRLLKMVAHEFAHNRGIDHCTDSCCCIQGYNHLGELDGAPMYFCSEDMAKICNINGWTLLEGYQKHLKALETISQKYDVNFSEDISDLKKKITALS